MRIRFKIILPFAALLVLTLVLITVLSISLLSRTLEREVDLRLARSAEILESAGFALNPVILHRMQMITDAEICTFGPDGKVLATTMDASAANSLVGRVRSEAVARKVFEGSQGVVFSEVDYEGVPYRVAYGTISNSNSDRLLVALAFNLSEIQEMRSKLQRTMGLVALLIVVLIVIFSHLIARTITSPLERLAEATVAVASGSFGTTVEVGTKDEVGQLSRVFNQMSRQLADSEKRLVRSEKLALTGQLSARVAHDIRNPLSSIKMQTQLLESKLEGRSARQQVDEILEDIERVETVLKELLDLASPGRLNRTVQNVNAVMEDALRMNAARLRHLGVEVKVQLAKDLPDMPIDGNRLARGLSNLIVNAMEAMPEGGLLQLESRLEDRDVVIEVCDTGIGLTEGCAERVFDPFFTTKREGVGLGLVNAKTVVELHGGTIRLLARKTVGTCTVVRLPFSR